MRGQCVLVFGISGVGKTTACEAYVSSNPEAIFVSASTLLKSVKGVSAEALRTADANEIVESQALLRNAFASFREGREQKTVLVDAHGVIDNDNELVRVPSSVIRDLEPNRLVLLEAPPNLVAERRATGSRKRPRRSHQQIAEELAAERQAVESFAAELALNLVVVDASEEVLLERFLSA